MFESIKLYLNEKLDVEAFFANLVEYGYERVARVSGEGDFDRRGESISVFPVTFTDPIRIELEDDSIGRIRSYDVNDGAPLEDHAIAIILPIRGIFKKMLRTKAARITERSPIESFVDIEPGDRVVHIDHGIGVYRGIEKHRVGKRIVDHIVLEYAEGDRLYLPFEDVHLLQKYVGFERRPHLHKLGSREWERTKKKAERGINNLALELLEVAAERNVAKGHAFQPDTEWQAQLESAFPFDETPDQARVSIEVKKDMERPKPMDRLICGDVGYGKTEIALRAAFKAVMGGRQVAMLVPTTILAEQHYTTFKKRMAPFPVEIEMLSRFRSRAEQEGIVKAVSEKRVDIIIGTHRLLSADIAIPELGLLIIDEEQRFGVRHKERLKRMRTTVDVLTMTATPIPRTLYLALMSAKDMSLLESPPQSRLPIKTVLSAYDESIIKRALEEELARKGQVFFVTSRILGIEKTAAMLRRLCPSAKVAVGHGGMEPKALEKTMVDFIDGGIGVLVSTNIVESGIDIPNANTMIINNAEQFGLADLYQLRGRVGRFNRQAYAYILTSKNAVLAEDAWQRLSAINQYTELGSGFRIAMKDLEIRGAGNILGPEQHGYINTLGFDLYCRMLRSAVDYYKKSLRVGE